MQKKNGFVFIETIICIMMLMTTFLTVFKLYYTTYQKYQNKYQNDNVQSVYKAYDVSYALNTYSDFKSKANSLVSNTKYIELIGPNTSGITFNNKSLYLKLLNSLGITNVYLIYDADTYYNNCKNNTNENKCNNLYFEQAFYDYIKTIKETGYILVIEEKTNNNDQLDLSSASVYTYITYGD